MTLVTARARRLLAWTAALLLATAPAAPAQPAVPSPYVFFGFRMGADRQLVDAESIERYFAEVAATSTRVRLVDVGPTTEGRRTVAAIISSAQNLAHLDEIKEANRRLADPRTLGESEAAALTRTHKAVVVIGCSIHASEIGASQAANELLHHLATATDATTLATLDQLIVIVIPMLNPDGHRLVTNWYERQKGTAFEGAAMPWLDHKYAGHDINRDAFMMNLAESRSRAAFLYGEWHPQVFLSMHQMGPNGPRFFVPPNADPIDANYDPLIWRTAGLLGGAMGFELQREGRRGVLSNGIYDYYWPGYEDSAPLGHNTVCLLTEVASVRVATPLTIPASDLRGDQKGLSQYRPQINFPDPWPGGTWSLRDIVDYDLTAVNGLLTAVTLYREAIVRNFYEMGRRAVDDGRRGGPFAFVMPAAQHDPLAARKLRELLLQGHIEIHRAMEPFRADGEAFPAGTDVILLAQPFRAYVKTLLETQRYPSPIGRVGSPDRPYDVTGWTLPLQMGVDVRTIERPFERPSLSRLTSATIEPAQVWGERKPGHYVIDARGTAGAQAIARLLAARIPLAWTTTVRDVNGFAYSPGSIVVPQSKAADPIVVAISRDLGLRADGVKGKPPRDADPIGRARTAVYAPWFDNLDEGWTRWLLDSYGFPYTTIRDADVRAGQLRTRFDAIVLPGAPLDRLLNGNAAGSFPAEYVGGLGETGAAALHAFVEQGGTLLTLGQAGELAIRTFALALRDVAQGASGFFCPGSLVRVRLDVTRPLAFGMPADGAAFCASSAAYVDTSQDVSREGSTATAPTIDAIARYGRQDVLLSGYLDGAEVIADQAAVIEVRVGAGRVVLFGFPPHHRGQSLGTFRLFLNALLTSPGPPAPGGSPRRQPASRSAVR